METALFDELKPMPPAGYTEVITGPARRATDAGRRLRIEPALVDRLLAETAEGADALPLLALTLERLYRDFGDDGDLTVAEYESMGGMAQVVQTEVDKPAGRRPRAAASPARHPARCVHPVAGHVNPDSDQPMRRLARWDDLPAVSHPLIEALVEKRLLVKDTRDGQTVVEVALESLLRQWRELAAWLRDEAQDLKDADTLERAAADWQASGRNESWLLEGTRLAEAETLVAQPGFRERLDPAREFLHASRQRENDRIEAEKQRQEAELRAAHEHAAALRKRSRILITVLAITAIIAVVAVTLGIQADRAEAATRTAAGRTSTERGHRPAARNRSPAHVRRIPVPVATSARCNNSSLRMPSHRSRPRAHFSTPSSPDGTCTRSSTPPGAMAFSPDGRPWSPSAATTTRCGCGTPTPAPVGEPLTGHTGTVWARGVQSRRPPSWSPAATTTRCGCGTPTPARRSASR